MKYTFFKASISNWERGPSFLYPYRGAMGYLKPDSSSISVFQANFTRGGSPRCFNNPFFAMTMFTSAQDANR